MPPRRPSRAPRTHRPQAEPFLRALFSASPHTATRRGMGVELQMPTRYFNQPAGAVNWATQAIPPEGRVRLRRLRRPRDDRRLQGEAARMEAQRDGVPRGRPRPGDPARVAGRDRCRGRGSREPRERRRGPGLVREDVLAEAEGELEWIPSNPALQVRDPGGAGFM